MKAIIYACRALAAGCLLFTVGIGATGFPGGHQDVYGPQFSPVPVTPIPPRHLTPAGEDPSQRVRHWNEVMCAANALDHTPVLPGDARVFGEQVGPARTARAFAIVHIAIFDAVNAIRGGYRSYTGLPRFAPKASLDAAIAQAAHDTLVALYPSQSADFDAQLAADLAALPNGPAKHQGIHVGKRAAAAILALRAHDNADYAEPRMGIDYIPSDAPGQWRQDPVALQPIALGAYWGKVTPFVIHSGHQFRVPAPPALSSRVYAEAFEEVQRLGGDGVVTPTQRSEEQTLVGIAWAYDGMPALGTPPRLFNQLALQIATQRGTEDVVELARLLALVNVAMADTAIAVWESKYHYAFWRPVTAIREADPGTGPTGLGDGNPSTLGDPTFTPLGAPASNYIAPNFTPPFPAYPSGHAGFAGTFFQLLRRYYGTDGIAFTFTSDELNGITKDNTGTPRPLTPLHYTNLSEAEEEAGQGRIYLGIHWSFDKSEGVFQGRRVGDFVFERAFLPHGCGKNGGCP